tara:strand:- start:747 stop:1046 length:300 start_codon:yes stop_codon:yes gene_type:complete
MDFLEDMELYEEAMKNAYQIITKKKTLDDIYYDLEEGKITRLPLPFDPFSEDGRSEDVIDVVIEYFTSTEEYEKCAELVKIKNKCLKTPIESDDQQYLL